MESGTTEVKQENRLSMGDLLQMPSDDFMSALSLNIFEDKFAEWERKLEQIRRKHNLLEPDRKFGMPSSILDSPQRSMGLFDGEGRYGSEHKLPFLPELVRKMAERRLEEELRSKHMSTSGFYDDSYSSPLMLDLNSPPQQTSTPVSGPSPVELKIPSYKPMKATFKNGMTTMASPDADDGMLPSPLADDMSNSSSSRAGDTLKDIIAKTIAEKVRSRTQVSGSSYFPNSPSPLATHNGSNYNIPLTVESPQYPSKRRRIECKSQSSPTKKQQQQDPVGPDGQASKKTRPKRGQYRKYNSQLLIEAVKAVQRGEMSVHRAGSYFGVPHSTLEYKVKERHLLRQKKGRETKSGGATTSSNGSSTATSGGSRSDSPPPCDKPSTAGSSSSCSAAAIDSPSPSTCSSSVETMSVQRDIKDEPREGEGDNESSSPETSSPEPVPVSSSDSANEDSISASTLLAAHANEMLMAAHAGNPAMMQLAHQAALSSLALGSPFPLLAAWGQPSGFLPLGLPDPTMMAAAAAAGYPFGGAFPGINTSASDLLKKLQQKVENKEISDLLEPGEIPRNLNSASSSSPDSTQVAAQ